MTRDELILARDAAIVAARAYEVGMGRLRPGECYTRYPEIETECLVVKAGCRVFLSGPGSASKADWNTNRKIIAKRIDCPHGPGHLPGRWHRGYATVATRAVEWYEAQLKEMADDDDTIVLCGHSLYGAVIGIVGAILIDRGILTPHRSRMVTFGAPRFAGIKAAAFLNSWWGDRARRWVYQSEVVPYLVPAIGMRHVGVLHQIVNAHVEHERGFSGFWRDMWSALRQPGFDLAKDHGRQNYINWLNAAIEKESESEVDSAQ